MLAGIGGAWLVGWGIACLQSSPRNKLDFWIPVTPTAIALVGLGILIVLAVMFDWPVPLVFRLSGLNRQVERVESLKVEIINVRWENYRSIALIGAFHVRLTNSTGDRVMLRSYALTSDNPERLFWNTDASATDRHRVDIEIHRRIEQHHYGPWLGNLAEVPAHETISAWAVDAFTRDVKGGTPACSIVVTDDPVRNQYEAHVDRVEPRKARIAAWEQTK